MHIEHVGIARRVLRLLNKRVKRMLSLSNMVTTFIGMVGFLYRLFIFVQMCILFYGETVRIKKYINFLMTNSKKIKKVAISQVG